MQVHPLQEIIKTIRFGQDTYFYGQNASGWEEVSNFRFSDYVYRCADCISRLDLARGSLAVLCLSNDWRWQAIEMALQLNGLAVIGLEKHFIEKESTYVNQEIRPAVIIFDAENKPNSKNEIRVDTNWLSLEKLEESMLYLTGKEIDYEGNLVEKAVVICTSGTTGLPKLISYTHRQVEIAVNTICNAFSGSASAEKLISWLPLSHLFQRVVNRAVVQNKGQVYFIKNPKDIISQMSVVKPTIWIGVPKFYEKVMEEIQKSVIKMKPFAAGLFRKTILLNHRYHSQKHTKIKLDFSDKLQRAALNKIVLSKLQKLTGGKVKFWVSGSAPLKKDTNDFWEGLNCPILQAYGVSENIVPIAMNTPVCRRAGSVGKAMAGVKVLIAEDSEILICSEGVYQGADVRVINQNKYYATGDLGYIDDDGFLFIQGRKSEVIKTSNGKKVFPSAIESKLNAYREIEQVYISGHGRDKLLALIYGISENLNVSKIQKIVDDVNSTLDKHEQIAGFYVINKPFSVETNEMTLNFKLRRHIIEKNYADVLNHLEDSCKNSERTLTGV